MSKERFLTTIIMVFFCSYLYPQTQIGADIDGEVSSDRSGFDVSMSGDGNRVAISSRMNSGNGFKAGHVRVFAWSNNTWTQIGNDIDGETAGDYSGQSISLSSDGNTLAIGAPYNGAMGVHAGHARVFRYNSGQWTQLGGDIDGEAAGDESGCAVDLSSNGNILAVGARSNDGAALDAGHVRMFQWSGGSWQQLGTDIDGEAMADDSGWAISLSATGTRIAIGAYRNDGNGNDAGHVRVFDFNGINWVQLGSDIDGEAAGDESGSAVSLSSSGNRIAIGALRNDGNGVNAGHVRVFELQAGNWVQIGGDIDGEAAGDISGISVSLSSDGHLLIIGAPRNDGNGTDSGHARIFEWNNGSWSQLGTDINGEAYGDWSGGATSLSRYGARVAISARFNDGNGYRSGHVRVFHVPVVLTSNKISLSVQQKNNQLILSWNDPDSENQSPFQVLHANDGMDWDTGFMVSKKSFLNVSESVDSLYTCHVPNPFLGHNYFQVKQVGQDGNVSVSNVAYIHHANDYLYPIYPNPAPGSLRIQTGSDALTHIRLSDPFGRDITFRQVGEKGEVEIQTHHKGLAILIIQTEKGNYSHKVIFR